MALRARRLVVAAAMLAIAAAARAESAASPDMAVCEGRGAVSDPAIQVQACTAVITAGEPPAVVASAYFRRANAYLGSQRYDQAIADYSQALTILPGDPLLLNNRC